LLGGYERAGNKEHRFAGGFWEMNTSHDITHDVCPYLPEMSVKSLDLRSGRLFFPFLHYSHKKHSTYTPEVIRQHTVFFSFFWKSDTGSKGNTGTKGSPTTSDFRHWALSSGTGAHGVRPAGHATQAVVLSAIHPPSREKTKLVTSFFCTRPEE
jgi:hypothetical protein